jgi:ribosomal protein L37E
MSPCPVCGTQVDTKNHKDCSNCGFPVILPSISYTSWEKIASGRSELLPQELLVWANKLYKEYSQLKQQSGKSNQDFNRHHSSLPPDDVINQLADNSQKQDEDEIQRSQSQIKELENQLSLVQSQFKGLLEEFRKVESELRQFNPSIVPSSQYKFSGFTNNLSKRISELQKQYIQPSSTANLAHTQSSSGNELQSQSQIEKLEQTIMSIPSQVANLIEGKICTQPAFPNNNLVESQLQQINHNLATLFTEIKEIKTNLNSNHQGNSSNSNTPTPERSTGYEVKQNYEIVPENEPDAFSDSPWVKSYNQDPESLSQYATEVSVTEENINQRRLGTNQPVILENSRRGKGNYWILPKSNTEFYLVPKAYLKINQYNIATVQTLFECIKEQEGNYNSKFILLQPATVSPVEQEKWQLIKLGILKF